MNDSLRRQVAMLSTKDLEMLIWALITMRDQYKHWGVKVVDLPAIQELREELAGRESRIRDRGTCVSISSVTERPSSIEEVRVRATRFVAGRTSRSTTRANGKHVTL